MWRVDLYGAKDCHYNIVNWRNSMLNATALYNPFAWANFTAEFKAIQKIFQIDMETLNMGLDAAMAMQARDIVNMGGHFFEVVNLLK